jgi:hypothetical protein
MKISKLLKTLLMPFRFYAVETDEDGHTIGTENDKRLKMYQDIADNNDKGRSEEFYEVDEDGNQTGLSLDDIQDDGTLGIVEEEEETESEEEETEEPVETQNKPDESLTKESRKYKITVNGVTKEVDEDWLVQTAQKVDSADDYLREAANLNNQARSLKTPQTETKEEEPDEVQLARAIQMGTEEEAVAAIRKLRSPTGPSSDDLARTIDERLTFQKAVDWFKDEYKDIVGDPVLNALAIQQDNMLRAQGDKRPYSDRFKDIGEGIRGWLKGKAPTPEVQAEPVTKVESTESKKARKAAAPQAPKPAATKVAQPVEEEEEDSVQDTIANMAKSRGGPQWLRG